MKIGTKIIATNSSYKPDVPNGTIMTVTHVFENNDVDVTVDGGDGFNWYMTKGTFEEYTPALPYGHVTMPDGRTVDLTAERQYRCDLMDPDELHAMKGHVGPHEWWDGEWIVLDTPAFRAYGTYRVAPKPVVRTQTIYGTLDADVTAWGTVRQGYDTHSITLTIKDNNIIDTKTEKL